MEVGTEVEIEHEIVKQKFKVYILHFSKSFKFSILLQNLAILVNRLSKLNVTLKYIFF